METLLSWFDLGSGAGAGIGPASASAMPVWQQALLYATVVMGVLLSESIAMAGRGRSVTLALDRPWLLTACGIALVVFPAVWRDLGAMPDGSLLVQMGLAAQGGVFWGVLLAGVEKRLAA